MAYSYFSLDRGGGPVADLGRLRYMLKFLRAMKGRRYAISDYDRKCLIDARKDNFETLHRLLSEYNAAKITHAFDPVLLQKILGAATDIYKKRRGIIEAGAVPEAAKLSYTRRAIPFQELNVEGINTGNLTVPTLITAAARAYLAPELEGS